MVLQELSLIPTLSVADNIFLNAEKTGPLGRIAASRERREARLNGAEKFAVGLLGLLEVSPRRTFKCVGVHWVVSAFA